MLKPEKQCRVGTTSGDRSHREPLVRAAHRAHWVRQGPAWMRIKGVGVSQAFSRYRLRFFPFKDSQGMGLLRPTSLHGMRVS